MVQVTFARNVQRVILQEDYQIWFLSISKMNDVACHLNANMFDYRSIECCIFSDDVFLGTVHICVNV